MRSRVRGIDGTKIQLLLSGLTALLLLVPAEARAVDPVLVGAIDAGGQPRDIAVQGRRVYVSSEGHLGIFELDPQGLPAFLGALSDVSVTTAPGSLMVRGTQIRYYDQVEWSLNRIDASDPENPMLAVSKLWYIDFGCVPFGANLLAWRSKSSLGFLPIVITFDPPSPPRAIASPPPLALSSLRTSATQPPFVYALGISNLTVIDLSNPAWPRTISSLAIPLDPGFASQRPTVADGGLLCIPKPTEGIVVVDVSNPVDPKPIAEISTLDRIYDMALSGMTLVAAVGQSGVEVFDLSNPHVPTRSGLITDGTHFSCVDVSGPFILAGNLSRSELRVYRNDRTFPPRIDVPPAPQVVNPGDTAVLGVEAQGFDTLTYQWQHAGTNLLESATCHGVNATRLALSNITDREAGAYRVIVSCLGESTTSRPATLYVTGLKPWGEVNRLGRQLRIALPEESTTVGLSAGGHHDLALRTNGTLFAWGANPYGQTNAPAAVTNAIAVAAGTDHNLALLKDGTVVAWGRNEDGQTNVPPTATNVVAVSAGWAHSLALRADGTVVAWGNNEYGQCSSDVLVSDAVAIAAGDYHSLALRADGTVVAWGLDGPAPEWATNAVGIAAGWGHSLALQSEGNVLAWGDDTYGQSTVPEAATNVVAIAAGFYHSLALRSDGTVVAWGKDAFNLVSEAGNLADISLLDAGEDHSTSLRASASILITPGPAEVYGASGGTVTFSAQVRGRLPHTYQWFRDAQPVPDATNRVLFLKSLEPKDAGAYRLRVSGPDGVAESEASQLTLLDLPPTVQILPARRQAGAGWPLRLDALAQGSQPLNYTWFHDGVEVPEATYFTLKFPSADVAASGSYWVVASNTFGAATSAVVNVVVLPQTDPAEIALALDTTNLVWAASPDSPWSLVTTNTADGVDALCSGPIDGELESWVETTVTGPAVIYWRAKLSGYDLGLPPTDFTEIRLEELQGTEDVVVKKLWTAYSPWLAGFTAQSASLRPGTQRLRWTFLAITGFPDDTKRALLDTVRVMRYRPGLSARRGATGIQFEVTGGVGWVCALEFTRGLGLKADWQTTREILMEARTNTFEIPLPDGSDTGFYRLRMQP